MTYALGLDTQEPYRKVALAFDPPVFAGKEFVHWFVEQIDEQDAPTMGALVLYFEGDTWRHVGSIDDIDGPRVVSKWGEMAVLLANVERGTPVQRIGQPEDVGGVAVFLASPEAAYITGQVLVVDGGITVREPA